MRFDRAAMGLAAAWFLLHVAAYLVCVYSIGPFLFGQMWGELRHFFSWQTGGFIALAFVVGIARPAIAGGTLVAYLIVSTFVLLAFSHDAVFVAKLALLLLWAACAVGGMRHLLARITAPQYATWGVAAAAVFAALIPLCFVLGVTNAIRPPIVALTAILTALPGALGWLPRLTNLPREIPQQFNRLSVADVVLLEVIWFILAIGFVNCSTMEIRSDTVRVHLPYIHQVIADHGISHQYACWHRLQPMAIQTCCAAFACLGEDIVAKWFAWLGLVALIVLVAEEVFRRSGSSTLGLFAGAAVLGCPLLTFVSASLHVDHIITLLCTAGFLVLFRALHPASLRGILLSAAIMGSMVQVKYTGLVFCVVWGMFLTVALLRQCDWRMALPWTVAGGVLLVATALPWHIYVYLGTGNPFYPCLHSWFPSPYWADGLTLQQVFEEGFKLDGGIAGVLSFPWTVTFNTQRFVEGPDGFMGFWVLALAPCWFLARSRRPAAYWDLVIVSVAMIAGIVIYTPYIRYWMPAYPLLVASCVLAAGSFVASTTWRMEGRWFNACCGIALVGILLLPFSFSCRCLPWSEYAKRTRVEDSIAARFGGYGGYEVIKQLNAVLRPNEGVICTHYEGVCLIQGRAYEFAFWWNDIHHIHDVASFADFCQRHGIRYWLVDLAASLSQGTSDALGISSAYWTDSRLVFANGAMAVYDVTSPSDKPRQGLARYQWPTALEKTGMPFSPLAASAQWVNLAENTAASTEEAALVLEGQARIGHRLPPGFEGRLCKVELDLWSDAAISPLLEIQWFNAEGNVIDRSSGKSCGKSDFRASVYSRVPPGATVGWVQLGECHGMPLHLKHGEVTFWNLPAVAETAQRDGHGP